MHEIRLYLAEISGSYAQFPAFSPGTNFLSGREHNSSFPHRKTSLSTVYLAGQPISRHAWQERLYTRSLAGSYTRVSMPSLYRF